MILCLLCGFYCTVSSENKLVRVSLLFQWAASERFACNLLFFYLVGLIRVFICQVSVK